MMDVPHARAQWARLLAYVTGLVNQKLLLQNEYLAGENRILRAPLPARMRLSDPERSTPLKWQRLGRAALQQVACVAKPVHGELPELAQKCGDSCGLIRLPRCGTSLSYSFI